MRRLLIGSLLLCGWATSALAQFSGNKIDIEVMGDQSGVVADVGGHGSILAARMAVEVSGGTSGGVPIETITADHQDKLGVASAIAREWCDRRGVDVIAFATTNAGPCRWGTMSTHINALHSVSSPSAPASPAP